jgi:hypothetical protein
MRVEEEKLAEGWLLGEAKNLDSLIFFLSSIFLSLFLNADIGLLPKT